MTAWFRHVYRGQRARVLAGSGLAEADRPLVELGQMSRATLADRWRRVRANLMLALQAGVAAGLAWFAAHDLIGHRTPFFAPIAAVITLAASVGQRLRRAVELVLGVAVGIAVGDLIIFFIGTGGAQIAVVVALAIMAAVYLGGTGAVVSQAASSAVLVATLAPPTRGIYYGRFIDALTGGLIAVGVMALLLPLNPLTVTRRAAGPLLHTLAEGMNAIADGLAGGGRPGVEDALSRLRAAESDLTRLRDALAVARETATLAPVRWRSRGALTQYVDAADHLGRALRNARVLARRAAAAVSDREPVPPPLPVAVRSLGAAVRALRHELGTDAFSGTREAALEAARAAGAAYRAEVGFSGGVIVAQVRSTAIDLLRATGIEREDATRAVRAAAEPEPADPGEPGFRRSRAG